jgi:hypothetical protein
MRRAWWFVGGALVVALMIESVLYHRTDDEPKKPIGGAIDQPASPSLTGKQDTPVDKPPEAARPDSSTKTTRLDPTSEDVRPAPETTGVGMPSGLTAEQRDKIRGLVAGPREARVDTSEFMPKVGHTVPSYVLLHRLPAPLADIMGAYHGSDYLIVLDQMVIVDPKSRRIVAVVPGV